ncbi:MAG: Mrp/NBP35 family ATP-binding protein [Clostridiales bacterium]|nr:Mrp/NBP35 family ATP-binding protein [Clostridiales bacterium]
MDQHRDNGQNPDPSQGCDGNCSSCAANCSSRESTLEDFRRPPHPMSSIKKVIGVISGKGGVGKSLVTSLLAVELSRLGHHVGVLDADITGPSIPRAFGLNTRAQASDLGLLPVRSKFGIDVMSVNLLLQDVTDPVVWRGPVIAGYVQQFWTDVIWKDVDFLLIDMPPGTGDVALTVFQTIPVDGILVVSSPQQLVSMIVTKAIKMANMMDVPILGLVENMSYVQCPDCGRKIEVFGTSGIDEVAADFGLPVLAKLPIRPDLARNMDDGQIELHECEALKDCVEALEQLLD